MNQSVRATLFLLAGLAFSPWAWSFKDQNFGVGVGYYSGSSGGKLTQSANSAGSFLGTLEYPLLLQYDYKIYSDYFLSPMVTYTLFSRQGSGSTVKSTTWQLILPVGKNIDGSNWDWAVGPGIIHRTLQGSGGTKTLNNGTTTATFAVPGSSVTEQEVTVALMSSYESSYGRFGIDLITEGAASSKRTYNLMLSYAYQFSSGGSSGSSRRSR